MISTALVPYEMYDAQVLDLIRKMDNPTPEVSPEAEYVASIKATLDGISLEGALNILEALGYQNDEFCDKSGKWKLRDLGCASYFPWCEGREADETHKLAFWGGPPNNLKWYFGTLFTVLQDRVLCAIQDNGVQKIATYIGTDLNPRVLA